MYYEKIEKHSSMTIVGMESCSRWVCQNFLERWWDVHKVMNTCMHSRKISSHIKNSTMIDTLVPLTCERQEGLISRNCTCLKMIWWSDFVKQFTLWEQFAILYINYIVIQYICSFDQIIRKQSKLTFSPYVLTLLNSTSPLDVDRLYWYVAI